MLYANGIVKRATHAGTKLVQSEKSRSLRLAIMKIPTSTSAGAVAHAGTIETIGEKNSARRKSTPVTNAVSPVRPPCSTPLALSTYEVTVDVPSTAPAVVPMASARRASLARGRRPSGSSMPARLVTPTRVPTVSKKSTKKKEKTTIQKLGLARPEKSIFPKIGMTEGGMETTPSGIFVISRATAAAVTARIPQRIDPLTFRASSATMTKKPPNARRTSIFLRSPSPTSTASFFTMTPAL